MRKHTCQQRGRILTGWMGLLCISVAANAQVASLTTNLLGRIDSKRVATGSSFFVKAISDWRQGGCRLRMGDTIEGRIVAVEHQESKPKREKLELRFLPITCAGNETLRIVPILVALQSPQLRSDDSMLNRAALMGAFASMIGASHNGTSGGVGSASPAAQVMTGGAGHTPQSSSKPPLRVAEARGFPGVALALPPLTTDPTGISGLRELIFEPDTQFILVPRLVGTLTRTASVASAAAPASIPVATSKAAVAPPEKESVDIETCVEGGCVLADTLPLQSDGRLERRLSLRALGYRTRGNRVLRSLAEDAALRFLGDDQLLVTFNAHPLIERSREDTDQRNSPRIIRALLLSSKSGKVLQAQDWRVTADGAYLWPLGDGRVLAHVGNVLTIYGPGLAIERQWTLPGALALLRVAPSRNLIVAVVIHERHTPDQHRRLQEFLGPERSVDEDYDLTILDGQLNVLGTKHMDAEPEMSDVLDSGLLLSDRGTNQRWKIREMEWSGKQHSITQVHSSCPVRMNSLPTNLILLMGCSGDASHNWYRVVRMDGKTLLTGATGRNEWLEDADALTAGGVFAIGILEAERPIDFASGMSASDFRKIDVSVYSAANGRRLYATRSQDGAVNRQSFALNEAGNQLAILSGEDVSLYKVGDVPHLPGPAGAGH